MRFYQDTDTIIAPITSTVGGSVSLLRISGPKSILIADRFFAGKNLKELEGGRFVHGQLKNKNQQTIDDVVVYLYRRPKSYTGEDVIEIGCHANNFIVKDILDLFIKSGCRLAEPGEFSKRAFLNGKMDLVQT
ncbi:MAG: tRNA uridine-5-carboxymethylaminomethyl(34) synthesis GTPase MnmE, partial [Caldithrix sp.]|nr:tRNA uridine-5-carboxymethylaminomethyl(34) synthesis GTPase MnmE [Caldithrix sp.]